MKLSIIIPVYRVVGTLRRCLDSVIGQSYQDWEIVLVNDASPDNSDEICKEYTQKDLRIRYVEFTVNRGLSAARNAGIREAAGEYITFIDSDDYIAPNTLEPLMVVMCHHPEYDFLEYPVWEHFGAVRGFLVHIPCPEEFLRQFLSPVLRHRINNLPAFLYFIRIHRSVIMEIYRLPDSPGHRLLFIRRRRRGRRAFLRSGRSGQSRRYNPRRGNRLTAGQHHAGQEKAEQPQDRFSFHNHPFHTPRLFPYFSALIPVYFTVKTMAMTARLQSYDNPVIFYGLMFSIP